MFTIFYDEICLPGSAWQSLHSRGSPRHPLYHADIASWRLFRKQCLNLGKQTSSRFRNSWSSKAGWPPVWQSNSLGPTHRETHSAVKRLKFSERMACDRRKLFFIMWTPSVETGFQWPDPVAEVLLFWKRVFSQISNYFSNYFEISKSESWSCGEEAAH